MKTKEERDAAKAAARAAKAAKAAEAATAEAPAAQPAAVKPAEPEQSAEEKEAIEAAKRAPKVLVKMKVSIAGNRCDRYDLGDKHGFSLTPEQELELHHELADAWQEAGHCERVSQKR